MVHGADSGGREEENVESVWLSTPEVSLQEVKSSWDAVGRIERLLDDQARLLQMLSMQRLCLLRATLLPTYVRLLLL